MKSKRKRLILSFTLSHLNLNRILLPNNLSIPKQQRRHRNKRNSQKAQQAISPAQTQCLVHSRSSKRQQGTEETTQGCHASDGGSGELGETVDHVGLEGREDAHEAEAEGDEGDDGDDPVDFVVGCPAVPGVVSE